MKKDRSFRQRNKQMHVQELTGVIALRHTGGVEAAHLAKQRHLVKKGMEMLTEEVSLPDARAFEDAGWHIVPRAVAEDMPSEMVRAKVFLKSGGRLALGTNTLTIQLPDDTSTDQANQVLEPYGCRVLEKLTFAPGLFRVALTKEARGDALDVANELVNVGAVKFAEPELIEVMTGR